MPAAPIAIVPTGTNPRLSELEYGATEVGFELVFALLRGGLFDRVIHQLSIEGHPIRLTLRVGRAADVLGAGYAARGTATDPRAMAVTFAGELGPLEWAAAATIIGVLLRDGALPAFFPDGSTMTPEELGTESRRQLRLAFGEDSKSNTVWQSRRVRNMQAAPPSPHRIHARFILASLYLAPVFVFMPPVVAAVSLAVNQRVGLPPAFYIFSAISILGYAIYGWVTIRVWRAHRSLRRAEWNIRFTETLGIGGLLLRTHHARMLPSFPREQLDVLPLQYHCETDYQRLCAILETLDELGRS